MGAAARTAGQSRRIASQSCGVRVSVLPAPKFTPPLAAAPGWTWRLLAPRLAIFLALRVEMPLPISIIAMTAAMPMMIPTQVSADRITFRRRARTAVEKVRVNARMGDSWIRSISTHGPESTGGTPPARFTIWKRAQANDACFALTVSATRSEACSPNAPASIRPSLILIRRVAVAATVASWVTRMIVIPSS